MVKHNLQISLRLFSKTLNTFSFSKHLLHSNAHVIHTGKHKWQQSNTNREHVIDWTQPLKIDVTCFKWCDTTNISPFPRCLRRDNIACDVDEVSGLTQPKDKKKHIDHMFTPLIFVPFSNVYCSTVHCRLYTVQWTNRMALNIVLSIC